MPRLRQYATNAKRQKAYRKRLKRSVHFSSAKENWGTPFQLFDALHKELHFTTDVCAEKENAKLPAYFDKAQDALKQEWTGVCWMNPPYGRNTTGKWMKKAYEASQAGATVVCLVPARTDTKWWFQFCSRAEVRFIVGRLNFIDTGATGKRNAPAPFPSAVIIFGKNFQAGKTTYIDTLRIVVFVLLFCVTVLALRYEVQPYSKRLQS
jgi:phage N-6-adenine-methyltransferase